MGWSGGAIVLGKLPVSGRPTNLDYSRARAYCACSRCGGGCLDIFTLIYPFSPLSPSLWETVRNRLKYCLKGPLNQNQPTNQPTNLHHGIALTSWNSRLVDVCPSLSKLSYFFFRLLTNQTVTLFCACAE